MNVARHTPLWCLLLAILGPSSGEAQCPGVPLELSKQDARLTISGTPTKIQPFEIIPVGGEVVTFAVDAVWKGTAARTIALYHWSGLSEHPRHDRHAVCDLREPDSYVPALPAYHLDDP